MAGDDLARSGRSRCCRRPPTSPRAPPTGDPNNRALVAHLRSGAFDLLLTADAESDVTGALDLPQVEALKVAHHGSDDPGLPAQLEQLRPEVAAIEVGRAQHLRPPDARRPCRARAPSRTSTAPTATARSSSTSPPSGMWVTPDPPRLTRCRCVEPARERSCAGRRRPRVRQPRLPARRRRRDRPPRRPPGAGSRCRLALQGPPPRGRCRPAATRACSSSTRRPPSPPATARAPSAAARTSTG